MRCPGCGHIIEEAGEFCGRCGYRYAAELRARLESYFELKDDLDELRSIARDQLQAGIEKLSESIERHYADEAPASRPAPEPAAAAPAGLPPPPPPPPPLRPEQVAALPPLPPEDKAAAAAREDLSFETAMGQKWLLIIGVVATVFGVGYFLKYSFEQGWVGPAGRVAMAYLWGAAFLFGGNVFRRRGLENFGLYLSGGGIATLYFATFAAFQIYHLIGQAPSFLLMVMVTSLAAGLAVFYDAKWLAVLGLIGGFLTPVLLGTGQDNQLVLMSYMTILNLGMLAVAFRKKWDLLTVLGFFSTYLLYAGWYARFYAPAKFWPAVIFITVFYLIYTVMPFLTRFVRREEAESKGFAVIIPNSFIAFGYSYYMVKAHFSVEAVGVISVFYAAVFLAMASYAFRAGKQDTEGFVVLAAKAMLFLVITVPLVFSKHWITVFWSAQAAALMWMALKLDNKPLARSSAVLFLLAAGKLFLHDYPDHFGLNGALRILPGFGHMAVERWITAAIFFILYWFSADMARGKALNLSGKEGARTHPALFAAFGVLLFAFLNVETSAFFYDALPAARFAAISVLWAVFSVALVSIGFRSGSAELRKTALVLFMVTVGKVFFFDMANISTPYRIVSFIMLGLILVGTSYLYHKFKHKLPAAAPAEEEKNA